MKQKTLIALLSSWLVLVTATEPLAAQAVPPRDPGVIAKYDKNRNGRLEADELAAFEADEARAAGRATATGKASAADPIVVMSPFEVDTSTQRGYYGANTMSGTRLNSKIEDLASSIAVVTKEQMQDLAMLDINDIFAHAAGTEGLATYTDFTIDRNGSPVDSASLNPNSANRVRGIDSANIALGNFETSGQVPVDPISIDAIEITRGPNSSVFGVGNSGGTLNMVPASANVQRNRAQTQVRADSFDGYRASLDVNRVLRPGVLGIRGSAVFQHDESTRKPSGRDSVRLNGMVKFQPFKRTTLTASYSNYESRGRQANIITPQETISFWRASGSPTWDPPTTSARLNGQTIPFTGANIPGYFQTITDPGSLLSIDQGKVMYWTTARASSLRPTVVDQPQFHYVTTQRPVALRANQPLFASDLPASSKSLYDWSTINAAAMTWQKSQVDTAHVQLEQTIFDTRRQMLAVQAGWFREDSNIWSRSFLGAPAGGALGGNLYVDVNQRNLDGTPNPNFLRPFIGIFHPYSGQSQPERDIVRAQFAYRLDLRQETNRWQWLGAHNLSGYAEYKDVVSHSVNFRDVMVSNHAWLAADAPRANASSPLGPVITRSFYQYYVGDANGQNVDYAPTPFAHGTVPYVWGDAATGNFNREPVTLGLANAIDGTGRSQAVLKTRGGVLQSYLLGNRVVTTFGLRRDESYTRRGVAPRQLDGINADSAYNLLWSAAGWAVRKGDTRSMGVVVKPVAGVSLFANKSNSFKPAGDAQNLLGQPLPDPRGEGTDVGFALNVFQGKLNVRVNQYTTRILKSRASLATTLTARVLVPDFSMPFALRTQATNWVRASAAARGTTLSTDEIDRQVAGIMRLPVDYIKGSIASQAATGVFNIYPVGETTDTQAKGREIEINFNPSKYWTLAASATETESIDANVGATLGKWMQDRVAVWRSIIDPITGQPWFTTNYGGTRTAEEYYLPNVPVPFRVFQAAQGKSRPQIRKYNFRASTSYRLAGLTEHRWLRNVTVGTAMRWEDRGAIGYFGVEQLPAQITDLDPNRPIFDKRHVYFDPWVRYGTRLFRQKVGATFQVNIKNIQENGRLQPISAWPDGTPNAYRIVDPRQIVVTATFDL